MDMHTLVRVWIATNSPDIKKTRPHQLGFFMPEFIATEIHHDFFSTVARSFFPHYNPLVRWNTHWRISGNERIQSPGWITGGAGFGVPAKECVHIHLTRYATRLTGSSRTITRAPLRFGETHERLHWEGDHGSESMYRVFRTDAHHVPLTWCSRRN